MQHYTKADLENMTSEELDQVFADDLKQLDRICLDAVLIMVVAMKDGETIEAATEKAADYLRSVPGYENAAQALLNGLEAKR